MWQIPFFGGSSSSTTLMATWKWARKSPDSPLLSGRTCAREFITTHLLNRDGVKFPDCTCLEITIRVVVVARESTTSTLPLKNRIPSLWLWWKEQTRRIARHTRGHQPPVQQFPIRQTWENWAFVSHYSITGAHKNHHPTMSHLPNWTHWFMSTSTFLSEAVI